MKGQKVLNCYSFKKGLIRITMSISDTRVRSVPSPATLLIGTVPVDTAVLVVPGSEVDYPVSRLCHPVEQLHHAPVLGADAEARQHVAAHLVLCDRPVNVSHHQPVRGREEKHAKVEADVKAFRNVQAWERKKKSQKVNSLRYIFYSFSLTNLISDFWWKK